MYKQMKKTEIRPDQKALSSKETRVDWRYEYLNVWNHVTFGKIVI